MDEHDNAANAPLVQAEESLDSPSENYGNRDTLHRARDDRQNSPTTFIWALTFTTGISGLLFGYESVLTLHILNINAD